MRLLSFFASALLIVSCGKTNDPLKYVDPFIGTDGIVHTFPGATTPFGMVQLSPDGDTKGWNWCSGYHTSDSTIMGFSHTHLSGTGWSDLGDILVMPTVGEIQFSAGDKSNPDNGYRSRISHDAAHEKASAGYYSVDLLDYNIKAELTATPRTGLHRYTFPKSDQANIIFDPVHKIYGKTLETNVKVLSDTTISGYCYSNGWGGKRYIHFLATFSKPFNKYTIYSDSTIVSTDQATSKDAKIALSFNTEKDEQIVVKVAISSVDSEGAELNYKIEAENITFDMALKSAEEAWREKLSRYDFKTNSDKKKRILYTGLYHTMIQPNLSQDVDGRYWAQGKIQRSSGYTNYSTFSLWDTFRAVHPLFSITEHGLTADFANSLISRHQSGGQVPLWELMGSDNACMISYPGAAMISEAIVKDIRGIDAEAALEALKSAANHNYISSSDGKSGVEGYNKYGYVVAGVGSSVSKTAENSYYDWCIAQIAAKIGDKATEKEYLNRSMRFLNHFDPKTNLMMPKDSLGNFVEVDLLDWESLRPHYVSGNVWAYSYFYPHAADTMYTMMGGKDKFIESMDKILATPLDMKGELHVDISGFFGHYGHGDEPGHQFAYMFSEAGEAGKAAKLINMVSDSLYNDTRNGMPNNDDCGQMSAWYIFSSMGFYPVSPASGQYIIGAPMIDGVTIKTDNGTTFTMKANNLTDDNIYVKSVTLNGENITRNYITHSEIMDGGVLEFEMTNNPTNFLSGK